MPPRIGATILAVAVAGCASGQNPWSATSTSGVQQLLPPQVEPFTSWRLAAMIRAAAGTTGARDGHGNIQDGSGSTKAADAKANEEFDNAVASFRSDAVASFRREAAGSAGESAEMQRRLRDARNEVQGQLISASINRCNEYKTYLRRGSSRFQFYSGSLSTVFGTVGALVSGGASQVFSGLAGLASGINAEYQQDMLSSVTTSVIIPGIDKQRGAVLANITERQCLSLSDYGLSMAIADAIQFHGQCTIDVGIAAASQSIARTDPTPVGLLVAGRTTAAINSWRGLLADRTATKGEQPSGSEVHPQTLGDPRPIGPCPALDAQGRLQIPARQTRPPSAERATVRSPGETRGPR